jgi:signal peptidase II
VAIDQAIKIIIRHFMEEGQAIQVIKDNIFSITYVLNPGIALGIFGQGESLLKRGILLLIILAAMGAIFYYWRTSRDGSFTYDFSCGLILGGAVGNYIDRIYIGKVVDFIAVGYKSWEFPVFNGADSAVSIGVTLFIIKMLFFSKEEKKNAPNPS